MRVTVLVYVMLIPDFLVLATGVGSLQAAATPCHLEGALVTLPQLPEASGIAASRSIPGRFWSHNDSGEPVLFMLDERGSVVGRLQLSGATVVDWEAVAVARCAAGSCLYIGDIGDNGARRTQIAIYRVPEPTSASGSARADVLNATYPDGAQDAEALLATPDGALYIVTKGATGPIALYRVPRDARPGVSVQLERVGKPRPEVSTGKERITDGAVSPDGEWVVLRTAQTLSFYRSARFFNGDWQEQRAVSLEPFDEPQGEGVTFGAGNSVYITGEGGGRSQPGTFAKLTCPPPR
jgi:hypothetical protein